MRYGANEQFGRPNYEGIEPEVLPDGEIIDENLVGFEAVGKKPKAPEEALREYFEIRAKAVLEAQEQALIEFEKEGTGISSVQADVIRRRSNVAKGMEALEQRKKLYRGESAA